MHVTKPASLGASGLLLASRLAWAVAAPALGLALRMRARRGREDIKRIGERHGRPSLARPSGPLCWIHAASLGESRSVGPLIRWLVEQERMRVLITTVTVTSARALATSLPPSACHQYAPLDRSVAVRRFLDHWRPDCALRVESEFWPETLSALARRRIPRALVQARLSARSAGRWRRLGNALPHLLQGFDPVVAQTRDDRERLRALGVRGVRGPLNLKADADAPAWDQAALAALQEDIGTRPFWLAASTHPGEEDIALAAHARLASSHPGLLTILLPRHPDRGSEVADLVRQKGLQSERRSTGALPGNADVYIADTLGETGLFYRLVSIAFVGGTLAPRGGHNLLEPAGLDCAILHGPDVANVSDVAAELGAANASLEVRDADTLGRALHRLLSDSDAAGRMAGAALRVSAHARGATEEIAGMLADMVRAARTGHAGA